MQGTAITEAEEFYNVYKLNVIQVPSRLPNQRLDHDPVLFVSSNSKLINLYVMVMQAHWHQRPVLIGTSSVDESEEIQWLLEGKRWPKYAGIPVEEVWLQTAMMAGYRRQAKRLAPGELLM